ncbi:hypothetical protein AB0L50_00005, partial [Streptomyces flaveolus]
MAGEVTGAAAAGAVSEAGAVGASVTVTPVARLSPARSVPSSRVSAQTPAPTPAPRTAVADPGRVRQDDLEVVQLVLCLRDLRERRPGQFLL